MQLFHPLQDILVFGFTAIYLVLNLIHNLLLSDKDTI